MMWGIAEFVAIATDLAEFLGAAVGFLLLFHVSLMWGGILTAFATFIILGFQRHGFRSLEAVISALVGVIAFSYLIEVAIARPDLGQIVYHSFIPQFRGMNSVVLATGILGATVMPHVIYLHSSLTQGRIITRNPVQLRRLLHFEIADILIAMGLAGLINVAMLVMAAAVFHRPGFSEIGTIEEAHKTLKPLMGEWSSIVFGVSLLASGLSSSAVGTMAGQVIMQGFIRHRIPVWLRRGVTMTPALIVIYLGYDPTRVLVMSQVVLSFGIPFALIPLIQFTRDPKQMGVLVNKRLTTVIACCIAALIVGLNIFLIAQIFRGS